MSYREEVLALDIIDEPTAAMRTDIPRDEVFELGADIKKNGLINPITVRPKGERYEVVAGHRRYLAHRYTGLATIRCIIRELSDDEAFAIMTSENLKRENVNPVDEATHTERLMKMHNGDVGKVSDIVGRSVSWVESRMQIAAMPSDLKDALRSEKIKLGVALALSEITDDVDRSSVLTMAINQGVSVVMAQYWVAQWRAGLWSHASTETVPDSNMPEGQRTEITLVCNVDGEKHPVSECASIVVWRGNLHHVHALQEALKQGLLTATPAPVEN